MNERLRLLVDREHQIGHAWLFGVRSMDDLRERFGRRILPLLAEYFFDDWSRICLVLGEDPVKSRPTDLLCKTVVQVDRQQLLWPGGPRWRTGGPLRTGGSRRLDFGTLREDRTGGRDGARGGEVNDVVSCREFGSVPVGGHSGLVDRELEHLVKLRETGPSFFAEERRAGGWHCRFAGFAGAIVMPGGRTLEILPKIAGETETAARSLIMRMLAATQVVPAIQHDLDV